MPAAAKERNIRVVNPVGMSWNVKFVTPDAAWSRIQSLVKPQMSREELKDLGWQVLDRK